MGLGVKWSVPAENCPNPVVQQVKDVCQEPAAPPVVGSKRRPMRKKGFPAGATHSGPLIFHMTIVSQTVSLRARGRKSKNRPVCATRAIQSELERNSIGY